MGQSGWRGVDLDGTLAFYDGWKGIEHIGDPIPLMKMRVEQWLERGDTVKIMTARAGVPECIPIIQDWCEKHGLPRLEVTDKKDFAVIEIWDDRAVCVRANSGEILGRPKD